MGDKLTGMLSGFLPEGGAPKIDIMASLTEQLTNAIPPELMAIYEANSAIVLLATVSILVLLAIQGYKLFKMVMYAGSAFLFGWLGYQFLAPNLAHFFEGMLPMDIKLDALIALACGLIAVLLTRCAYNFMIMMLGGVAGYFLGSTVIYGALINYFYTLEFLTKFEAVKYIVGGVFAGILGILFILMFKHLFMILTSFGCSIGAALIVQSLLMPTASDAVKIAFAVLGFTLGIYAVCRQYREEEKDMEIVF